MGTVCRMRRALLALAVLVGLLAPSASALSIESHGGFVAIPWEAPFNLAWTNPSYAVEVPNGSEGEGLYAEAKNVPGGWTTIKRLIAGGFGLQVPTTAKITGFASVAYIRDYPGYCNLTLAMSLVKAGTFSETKNRTIEPYQWPFPEPDGLGGPTDRWGEPLWTASEIDSTSFGVSLQLTAQNCGQTVIDVDHLGVIVYYTLPVKTAAAKHA